MADARPAWLWPVLAVFLLVNGAMLLGGISAVRSSPRLEVDSPVPGLPDCAWRLAVPEGSENGRCISSLAGVELAVPSLARHPIYLETAEDFDRWRADQAAIDAATRGTSSVSAQLVPMGAAPTAVQLPLRTPSWSDALYRMLPTSLTVIFITGVAALVLARRPRQRAAQALLLLCQAAIVCSLAAMVMASRGLTLSPALAIGLPAARMIGGIIGLMALIDLMMVFPVQWLSADRRRWVSLGMGVGLLLSTGAWLAGVFSALMAYTVLLVVVAMVAMGVVTRRIDDTTARLQARWVLWGVAIPIVAWALVRLPAAVGFDSASEPSDAVMMVASNAIPLGLGVAILRHNLFDIEVYVRRTVIGALVTAAVLVTYHGGLALFASEVSRGAADAGSHDATLLVALVLAFALMPVQQRMETALDRTFARNRFHYRRVLREVAEQLTSLDEASPAARAVLEAVVSGMSVRRGGVVHATGAAPRSWWVDADDIREQPGLGVDSDVWQAIVDKQGVWIRGEAGPEHPVDRWMAAEGLEVVLPLRTATEAVGLLACGSLPGRQLPGREDIVVLRHLASALALALSHAAALEQIRRMNADLESTVQHRTAELSRARVKLFQWEKMASLGALAAGVAHELNTPLGVIRSSADLLRETLPEGRQNRMARLVGDAARRAADIVTNLRAFSRPERQGLELVELPESLRVTLNLLDTRLRRKEVTVEVVHHDPPAIRGYPAMLNQTLSNLIVNASDASPPGGVVTVETWATEAGGARVQVRDQGDGIPEDVLDRVFEPFFTTKGPGGGTGLGLSLCYAFVRQHGGSLTVHNADEGGAVFTVLLPPSPPVDPLEDADPAAEGPPAPAPS